MFNLNTLDTAIAVVIVLLILSLVVQSVQQGLKKLLKIKSRQIEDSLVDLFEHVLNEKRAQPEGLLKRVVHTSPLLRIFSTIHPAEGNDKVKDLYEDVKKRFEEAGRVSQRGKLMLDSIAKTDLMKVLGSVSPGVLMPDISTKLNAAIEEFKVLKGFILEFTPSKFSEHMSEEAREKLAQMQGALRPLVNDVQAYLRGEMVPGLNDDDDAKAAAAEGGGGKALPMEGGQAPPKDGENPEDEKPVVTSATILRDVTKLNELRLGDAARLISEAQKAVEEQLARAQQDPNGAAAVALLTEGADTLRVIARGMASFDRTVDQLLANLTRAEKWFDTVMQSFEERYTRGMKTWGIVISFCVVVLLNANFFDVYKNIAANDTMRANIVQMRDDVSKRLQAGAAAGDPAAAASLKQLYQDISKDVGESASAFTGLGFKPLWEESSQNITVGWFFRSLLGWLLMTLLLSVGAPFWEDVLESLFGLKNVLRKRSDTKNVEDKGGQTRP